MKAKKENKVYTIDETRKKAYLNEGYDIYDENDKLIEYSPKKLIAYAEYMKKVNENEKLTDQVQELSKEKEELSKEKEELTKKLKELEKIVEANKKNEKTENK
nr:MAG TPA: protein of unknown function (DUF5320) [Caudoviricetes sp.]